MAWDKAAAGFIELIIRTWDWVSGRPKKKLQERRRELEAENRQAQINGDLVTLRRTRGQIEEVDRKLRIGDYS